MRKTRFFLLQLVFFVAMLVMFHNQIMVYAQNALPAITQKQTYFEGTILSIEKGKNGQMAIVQPKNEPNTVTVPLFADEKTAAQNYAKGDEVILLRTETPGQPTIVYIVDFVRTNALLLLTALFVITVCVVGRMHGLLAILSMVYSFLIIGKFIIPNIVIGNDPIFIALLGGMLISPVTFYLSHGFNKKTTVAVVGTVVSLVFTGILSLIFVNLAKLTGVTSDEALYVKTVINQSINLKSLLLAGMIIGLLGILDDITVSQAAIVEKLIKTSEKLNMKEIFTHSMEIGKDHIASLVNTLVLVYAGASLPLFLLFYNSGLQYSQVISSEIVATEIVRTLIGSIGLVAAVPITTLFACFFLKKN